MAPRSGFVRDIQIAVAGVRLLSDELDKIAAKRTPVIFSPTAPQSPFGSGGVSGAPAGEVPSPGADRRPQVITSAGSLAPAGGAWSAAAVGGGPAAGAARAAAMSSAGGGGVASGVNGPLWGTLRTTSGGRPILVTAYPPGDPAAVGRPVQTSYTVVGLFGVETTVPLDGFDCSFALDWPEWARITYWRKPDAGTIGGAMSSGASGGRGNGPYGRPSDNLAGNRGDFNFAGSVFGTAVPVGAPQIMGGKSTDTAAVVNATQQNGTKLDSVVSAVKELTNAVKSGGTAMRAGGLA